MNLAQGQGIAGRPPDNVPTGTMEARLDNLLGILNECEALTFQLHAKYFGPIPSGNNEKVSPSPVGLSGRLMEAINRSTRLAEGLQSLSQELA